MVFLEIIKDLLEFVVRVVKQFGYQIVWRLDRLWNDNCLVLEII